ncbi:MAG: hypothetical protein ACOCUV_03400 [bacterium]
MDDSLESLFKDISLPKKETSLPSEELLCADAKDKRVIVNKTKINSFIA